jgi:hypothetical protein
VLASNTVMALMGDPLGSIRVESDGAGAANLVDVARYFKVAAGSIAELFR